MLHCQDRQKKCKCRCGGTFHGLGYHGEKEHLETAYAMQSSKTVAFLGFIQSADPNKTLKDYILPQLTKFAQLEVRPVLKPGPEEKIVLEPEVIAPHKKEEPKNA
jgi:hypothetical protein